jgi:hypothetical protein
MVTASAAPLPVCKAILLCQHVDADVPGRINLTGVVSNLNLDKSLIAPPIELFCQITDAMGHYRLVVEVHDIEANEVVGRSEPTEFEAIDRLMNLDIIMSIEGMKFSKVGLHDIVVFANNEEVDRKQFAIVCEDADHASAK